MKSIRRFFLLATVVFAISTSSCKKDWTCSCYTTDVATGQTVYFNVQITNQTRNEAEASCAKGNNSVGTAYSVCNLP